MLPPPELELLLVIVVVVVVDEEENDIEEAMIVFVKCSDDIKEIHRKVKMLTVQICYKNLQCCAAVCFSENVK